MTPATLLPMPAIAQDQQSAAKSDNDGINEIVVTPSGASSAFSTSDDTGNVRRSTTECDIKQISDLAFATPESPPSVATFIDDAPHIFGDRLARTGQATSGIQALHVGVEI